MDRCAALDRLRTCISRKRISFRLFKQWYWESFDDDVQVRTAQTRCTVLHVWSCGKGKSGQSAAGTLCLVTLAALCIV